MNEVEEGEMNQNRKEFFEEAEKQRKMSYDKFNSKLQQHINAVEKDKQR